MPPAEIMLRLSIIPGFRDLPDTMRSTLLTLAELIPFISVAPRDLSGYEPGFAQWCAHEDNLRRLRDFHAWTAAGARVGLLQWPERDAIVAALSYHHASMLRHGLMP